MPRASRLSSRILLVMFALIALGEAAKAQTSSGATVQPFQTGLTLPAGNSVYIYGMATGGLNASSSFSQGTYQQLTDASGQLTAALAVTPSNSNSFSTSAAYYTIGGVGVSGFTNMAESFGSNNSPGASSASDTFTVTQSSLVVVVAMAGGQSYLTLSGVPSLQIDAQVGSQNGGVIGMVIAHANLSPGTYTVTENSFPSPAPGQDPNHMADLIGVFIFSGGSLSDAVNLFAPCLNGLQVDINGAASPGASVANISWNWGDGQQTTGFFPQSHTYSSLGTYTIQATAHYNDGSSTSASQAVTLAGGPPSNCVALTISASPGGSVFYQASVGSATIAAGTSVTLQLDFADDLFLTANPSSGGLFSSWSASAGITGTGGSPVSTTSAFIDIVVRTSSNITADFIEVLGVQNSITLNNYSLTQSTNCYPGFASCSSIQQNIEIGPPTQTEPCTYWAQNSIVLQKDALGLIHGLSAFQLFNCSNLLQPIECAPPYLIVAGSNGPACVASIPTFLFVIPPATWTMTAEINSSHQLVMTNPFSPFGGYTFHQSMPNGAYINLGTPAQGPPFLTPEVIFVGIDGGAQATFNPSTNGTIRSFVELTDGSWSSSLTLIPRHYFPSPLLSDSVSAEGSSGLLWGFAGSNTTKFGGSGIPAEGFGFVPSTPVAKSTMAGGQASANQTSSPGATVVSVTIRGSTAKDGTKVTIATASEGAAQPPGTGQLNLGSAGFYDVSVSYFDPTTNMPVFPDGTATVCISSSFVSSQTVMQYWNNGSYSWVVAANLKPSSNPPNTICGDIPVAALSGTPIAIGPLETNTPPKVDLDSKVLSLTLDHKTHQYVAVLDVTNSGSITASDVQVTVSELNATPTSTALPVTLGDLSYAASATVTLTFPARGIDEEDEGLLRITETYAGGGDEQIVQVRLPRRGDRDDDK